MSQLDLSLSNELKFSVDSLETKNEKEISQELERNFKEIAKELINNYCIVKKKDDEPEVVYRFMELEFYYFSSDHPDIITYPRKAEAGDWFFHSSGVDICFESNVEFAEDSAKPIGSPTDYAFGGILIRALSKQVINEDGKEVGVEKPYITGPLNCCYELFDKFSAFGTPKNFPIIKKLKEKNEATVLSCGRYFHFSTSLDSKLTNIYKEVWGKGDEGKDPVAFNDYLSRKYCFYDEEAFKKCSKDKLGKSYQANPIKIKVDTEGKEVEHKRLSYK